VALQLVGGAAAIGILRVLYPDVTPVAAADVVVPHDGVPERALRDP
jgi:hypothetical protein